MILESEDALDQLGQIIRFSPDSVRFVIGTRSWRRGLLPGISENRIAHVFYDDLIITRKQIEDAFINIDGDFPAWRAVFNAHQLSDGWPGVLGHVLSHSKGHDTSTQDIPGLVDDYVSTTSSEVIASIPIGLRDVACLLAQMKRITVAAVEKCLAIENVQDIMDQLCENGVTICCSEPFAHYYLHQATRMCLNKSEPRCPQLTPGQHECLGDSATALGDLFSALHHFMESGTATKTLTVLESMTPGLLPCPGDRTDVSSNRCDTPPCSIRLATSMLR